MKSKAFLLGFFSVGGQVLLLRELISSFNGDELFIGTALFGWLLSVAAGSWIGGRLGRAVQPIGLFGLGALMLVVMLLATRFAPLVLSGVVGEAVAFGPAALVSIVVMLPAGLVSGWLFAAIANEGWRSADAVVTVYLWEGIGAFAGGVAVALLTGGALSSLSVAVGLAVVVVSFAFLCCREHGLGATTAITAVTVLLLVVVGATSGVVEKRLDGIKYSAYDIEKSFDTHYGHQAILSRDSLTILVTDNKVEAVFPGPAAAENLLIPPLLYRPAARDVLLIGRTEFGVAQLARRWPQLELTALDPRWALSHAVDDVIRFEGGGIRRDDDPVSYLVGRGAAERFDVIIVPPGEPDNFKLSRLLSVEFFKLLRCHLKDDGIAVIVTDYDTDRYLSAEVRAILATIHKGLRESFEAVWMWPGETTLLFASPDESLEIPVDSLLARVAGIGYEPRYLSESFLADRLGELKIARLETVAREPSPPANSLQRPVLPTLQAVYRSMNGFDGRILSALFQQPLWLAAVPVIVIGLWLALLTGRKKRQRFALFLFLVGGLVSLSLELISFYVLQTTRGSLYSEMAALVGVFMAGLAIGAYFSRKAGCDHLEYPALAVLLVSTLTFLFTFRSAEPQSALYYHLMFLFAVALATGSLFVAAAERLYGDIFCGNRGAGYAVELVGSSVGALITMTVLLPVIGLVWLLVSLSILLGLALLGSLLTSRGG
ncbi:MAG: hypothetical protein KAU35_07175 [candidate division Zixibacteria bacterium]|nr:hypothetical protein [candidate division Zixibacteria bacterium]